MNRQEIDRQLQIDEGFTAVSKYDVNGWRYGFGCTAPGPGAIISRQAAEALLSKRIDQAIQEYHEIFADQPMSDTRQGALVNMIFNMGKGWYNEKTGKGKGFLAFHRMIAAIKADNWEEAVKQAEDSLWYEQLKDSGDPPGRARRIVAELRG